MDTELMLDVGQANEFKLACRRAGYTNADVKRLCEGNTLLKLLPIVRGDVEVKQVTHIIDCDADPLLPHKDWKVEEHKKGGQLIWDPTKLTLYLSDCQRDDLSMESNELRREPAKRPVLNANVLDYLIRHPHLIPDEWKVDEQGNTHDIYFWGTIYQASDDHLHVRSLYLWCGHWTCSSRWLRSRWSAQSPAVLLAS